MTVNVLGSINTGRVVGVRELRQAQVHSLPDVDQCRGHVAGGARTPVTSAISIMASGPITSWQIDGETVEAVTDFILGGFKITADDDCSREIKTPWKESYDQPRQHIKKQRHYFANKGPSSQRYGFSSGHVWMGELDCEER